MVLMTDNATKCASCREPLAAECTSVNCPACGALYHAECWERQSGCLEVECHAARTAQAHEDALPHTFASSPLGKYLPWFIVGGVITILLLTAFLAVRQGVPLKIVLTIGVVIAALTFDYVNGMHDAGNAIATVISTRVLTPITALVMAAVLNLLGALVHAGVATSIATKFADPHVLATAITPVMILCGLVGASVWSFWTARIGLPVSTSHSLFGGLIGVFLLGGIKLNASYLGKIGMWMVLAPLMAFTVGWALMVTLMWIFRRVAPYKINRHFRVWQIFSSALMAFSHGSNDAQKAMGIITMALLSSGFLHVAPGA
ncbi:MAG TPA: inorganic phosphate transporter, partial [Armatimonadota bacterium]